MDYTRPCSTNFVMKINHAMMRWVLAFLLSIGSIELKANPLKSGDWFQMQFAGEGIYKITPQWFQSMGLNPGRVHTGRLVVFGGGRGPLPEANWAERPMGLVQYPIQFHGDQDGIFEANEFFLVYIPGSESLQQPIGEGGLTKSPNPYEQVTYAFMNPDWEDANPPFGASVLRIDTVQTGGPTPGPGPWAVTDRGDCLLSYEKELNNLIKSGREWLGEPFDIAPNRNFALELPSYSVGDSCRVAVRMAVRSQGAPSPVTLRVNGQDPRTLVAPVVGTYYLDPFFNLKEEIWFMDPGSPQLNINLVFSRQNTLAQAWLDRILVQGRPRIQPEVWPASQVFYNASTLGHQPTQYRWSSYTAQPLQVWDVTTPSTVTAYPIETIQVGGVDFQQILIPGDMLRHLCLIKGNAFGPPSSLNQVPNQNLMGDSSVDMVIVTPKAFRPQATQIAAIHHQYDGLKINIVHPDDLYREFSSGRRDIVAIRDYLRMLYHRKTPQSSTGPSLKYVLLLGSTSYDAFNIIPGNLNHVPTFQSYNSRDPLSSYCSDAFYGLMDSTEGAFGDGGGDRMDLGIGRIPVRDAAQATAMVRKIQDYLDPSNRGPWRNEFVFVADDQDYNIHLNDCAELVRHTETQYPMGLVRKIFLDAYEQESRPGGARYPAVNDRINRAMQDGCLVMAYMGHGGVNGLAEERIMTIPEIEGWNHPGRYPLMVTATCEFARFDNPAILSAGERALLNPTGGAIALLTTSRVTFTNFNLSISSRLFRDQLFRKEQGKHLRLGDLYKEAANPELGVINTRNFALLGDPALRLAFPHQIVAIDSVSDTLKALGLIELKGKVLNAAGMLDSSFNGFLDLNVMDKASSLRTKVNDPDSYLYQYSEYNNLIFKGKVTIEAGQWQSQFRVPKDINYVFGNGRINAYAVRNSLDTAWVGIDGEDAAGDTRMVVVGGSSTNAVCNPAGPRIVMSLNDSLFRSDGIAGSDNVLWVTLYDEDGINSSASGIGREMQLVRNGDRAGAQTLNAYFISDLDQYRSGRIRYPLGQLSPGSYTLELKAWDVCNNSSVGQLRFQVVPDNLFQIQTFSVYPNPVGAGTYPLLEFNHNRPGSTMRISLNLIDLQGRVVRSLEQSGLSQGNYFQLEPETTQDWASTLTNGLYLVYIEVECEGQRASAQTRMWLTR